MFPYPRAHPLNVAIFLSMFQIEKSPIELVLKINYVARSLLTARVNNLFIIEDVHDNKLKKEINELIKYSLLPPYLKKTIPIKKELKYAGLLEPMNFYYHTVHAVPIEGEIRIVKKRKDGFIETGLASLSVKSGNEDGLRFIIVTDSSLGYGRYYSYEIYYSGFKWKFIKLNDLTKRENLVIGSRSGKDPLAHKDELISLYETNGITLVIGPPKYGILRLVSREYVNDRLYNFFPKQGVKDIRAEEALLYSLGVLENIIESRRIHK